MQPSKTWNICFQCKYLCNNESYLISKLNVGSSFQMCPEQQVFESITFYRDLCFSLTVNKCLGEQKSKEETEHQLCFSRMYNNYLKWYNNFIRNVCLIFTLEKPSLLQWKWHMAKGLALENAIKYFLSLSCC